ncbi:hypothetical protein SSP531S_34300 [Streptomyces spongiicola]|uniref:Uncharacterized protein n=1 Tax=Streptomyces spongiicola TaxID=1690221 RepID=A0A388T1W3_9ACTN|nr:hypothetical protein SSP531S_34300 [Streptomyces spongiicola]
MSDSIHTPPAAHEASGAAQVGTGEPFPAPDPVAGLPGVRPAPAPGGGSVAARDGAGGGVARDGTRSTVARDATGAGPVAEEPAHDPAAPAPAPAPLGVGRVPTGHAGVDAHLERLGDADHLTADGHLAVYEDVHRGLRDTLTALDTRPDDPYDPRS